MTSDRMFCLRYHQKLVGSSCTAHVDTCYQRAGQWLNINVSARACLDLFVSKLISIKVSKCI